MTCDPAGAASLMSLRTGSQEHRNYARQKDAVKSAGAADRGNRSSQSLDLSKVQQISPDKRAQTATDISDCRAARARY